MRWDPAIYSRYAGERGRPYLDLLARIGADSPRRVVDLGCGPGNLTALLLQRWPAAVVEGIDSSPEMIAEAGGVTGVQFRVEDVTDWQMPTDADVVVSNATLQWVPTHRRLLRSWASALSAGGWLAFQVPGNFGSPSHQLMRALASSPRWRERIGDVLRHEDAVAEPREYAALLLDTGLEVDAWEATYLHLLGGIAPVLNWVRGTGLRPILAALGPEEAAEFEAEYAAALRDAYPSDTTGHTPFPFRRIFAVGHKP